MTHEIKQLMQRLHLEGMFTAYEGMLLSKSNQSINNDEFINLMLQAEYESRENKNLIRRLANARFRYKASLDEVDYTAPRGIDKTYLMRFFDCSFIKKAENILFTGPAGIGKSYISSALGHQACLMGYKVMYFGSQKLFSFLNICKADESYSREIKKIEKTDLLIIDDFGLQPLDANQRMILLEIIEDRHQEKSTIISSQVPVTKWYDIIGESTVADAILDRLVHTSHRIEMHGESMRMKRKK